MTATPFDGMIAKLIDRDQDVVIQALGDSTCQGMQTPPLPVDPGYGWVGRLGLDIAILYDVNYLLHWTPYNGYYPAAWSDYAETHTLRTATRSDAPTLTIWSGCMGGCTAAQLSSWIINSNMIRNTAPDVILIAVGFNDVALGGASAAVSGIQGLVTTTRSKCPTAPIVVTTENRSNGSYPTANYVPAFSQVTNYYVGQSLDLSPPLVKSTSATDVWCMDTMQAYTDDILANDVIGLHPTSVGYQAQADWMAAFIPSPIPIITTTTLGDVAKGVPFAQTLTANLDDVTWSIVTGRLPLGLVLDSATGTISGTPRAFGGSYNFTVRAATSYGYDEKQYVGIVIYNTVPFTPTNTARFRHLLLGDYYPVSVKIRTAGEFAAFVARS